MVRPRKGRETEKHHRLPRSRGGGDNFPPGNTIVIDKDIHRAWHKVVSNMTAKEIAKMLSDCLIDPRYYFVAVPRKKKPSKKKRKRVFCIDCNAEVLKQLPITCKGKCNGKVE